MCVCERVCVGMRKPLFIMKVSDTMRLSLQRSTLNKYIKLWRQQQHKKDIWKTADIHVQSRKKEATPPTNSSAIHRMKMELVKINK